MSTIDGFGSSPPSAASSFEALATVMRSYQPVGPAPGRRRPTSTVPDLGDAIIDSWASVLSVLGFYQDRIAAESYLPTAREEWSLREFAKLLGYTPSPGVGASGYLAFTLSSNRGLEMPILIKAGTAVRNAPLKGGQPQIFETTVDLDAHAAFNTMAAKVAAPDTSITVQPTTRVITVDGFPSVRPNDALLLTEPGTPLPAEVDVRNVEAVTPQPQAKSTVIGVSVAPPTSTGSTAPVSSPEITKLESLGSLFGHDAVDWLKAPPATQAKYGVPLAGPYVSFPEKKPPKTPADEKAISWSAQRGGLGDQPITCAVAAGDDLFVGTAGDGIFTARWPTDPADQPPADALAWAATNRGLTNKEVYALATGPEGGLYAGTSRGSVWRSVDGGRQWDQVRGSSTTTAASGTISATSTKLPATTVRALLVLAGSVTIDTADAGDETEKSNARTGTSADRVEHDVEKLVTGGAGGVAREVAEEVAEEVASKVAKEARNVADKVASEAREGFESVAHHTVPPTPTTDLTDDVAALRDDLTELRAALKQLTRDIAHDPTPTRTAILASQSTLAVLRNKIHQLQGAFDSVKADLATLQLDLATLQADLTMLHGDVQALLTGLTKLESDVTTLLTDLGADNTSAIHSDITNVEADIKALDAPIAKVESDTNTVEAGIAAVAGDIERLVRDLGQGSVDGPVVFAGTDQGLYVAVGLDGGWKKISAIGSPAVYAIADAGSNTVLIATSTGVARLAWTITPNGSNPPIIDIVPSPADWAWNHGPATALANQGTTWFAAAATGVFTWDGELSFDWTQTLDEPATSITAQSTHVLAGTSNRLRWSRDGIHDPWVKVASAVDWPPGVVPPPASPPPKKPPPPPAQLAFENVTTMLSIADRTIAISGSSGYANEPEWPQWSPTGGCQGARCLDLANGKAKVTAGQQVIITQAGKPARTLDVHDVDVVTRTDYGTTAKVTRLTFDEPDRTSVSNDAESSDQHGDPLDRYDIRKATIFAIAPADSARFQPHVNQSSVATSPAPRSVPTYGTGSSSTARTSTNEPALLYDGSARTGRLPLVDLVPANDPHRGQSRLVNTPTTYVTGTSVSLDATTTIPKNRLIALTGVRCRTMFTPPGGLSSFVPGSNTWNRLLDDWSVRSIAVVAGSQAVSKPIIIAATHEGPVLWCHRPESAGDAAQWRDAAAPIASDHVTAMLALSDSTLVAGTSGGELFLWDPFAATPSWSRVGKVPTRELPLDQPRAEPRGAGFEGRLPLAEADGQLPGVVEQALTPIAAIARLGSGTTLLIGTHYGAWTVDPADYDPHNPSANVHQDQLNGHVHAFCTGPSQSILAGTSDGVWRRRADGSEWDRFGTGIEYHDVIGLGQVRGRFYAATKRHGVLVLAGSDPAWRKTGWQRQAGCAVPTALVVTGNGSVVVGTEHDGLRILTFGAVEWARLEIGSSASIRSLYAGQNLLLAGSARAVIARDDHGRRHEIRASLVTTVERDARETDPTIALDDGVLPPSVTSALREAKIKLPKHYNVVVRLLGLKWEIDDIATPIVITLLPAGLRIELRPTADPLVSEIPVDEDDNLSAWTVDLATIGPATVRAWRDEIKLLTGAAGDEPVAEVHVAVDSTAAPGDQLTVHLADRLQTWYDASTVTVSANVVPATQGETTSGDVLGSGNATATFQQFLLGRTPLTYVPSDAPTGASPTLSVFVGERSNVLPGANNPPTSSAAEWQRVDTLMAAGAGEHAYMLREVVADDNTVRTALIFGDGVTGSRLPTGTGNVSAKYRVGIGGPSLPPGALSVIGAGPVGVRRVINPVATSPGEPPANFDDLQVRLPAFSLATDRVVSMGDYRAFSEQFVGIGQCDVTRVYDGRRESISVTVGGLDGYPFADGDVTGRLADAIATHRIGDYPFEVMTYDVRWFALDATIHAAQDADRDQVVSDTTRALLDRFGIGAREIGASVERLSVQVVLESIDGCVAATIDDLHVLGCPSEAGSVLVANRTRYDPLTKRILPAMVVAVSPPDIRLRVIQR